MSLKYIYGFQSLIPVIPSLGTTSPVSTSHAIDAVNEEIHFIGEVFLEEGSGSKTFSSSGGEIHWRSGSTTFSNAGTTIRVGIQNAWNTTGPVSGDGTYDVYDDLIGGTDTITSNSMQVTAMTTGSITISHGQKIAVGFLMSSRGGTDSATVLVTTPPINNGAYQTPVVMLNTTGSFVRHASIPNVTIKFDDGTFGWINGAFIVDSGGLNVAYNVNTAGSDEYGNLISLQYPIYASGIVCSVNPGAYTADMELCLYSDPLGTPSLIEAITIDADSFASTSHGTVRRLFSSVLSIKPGVYGVTVRPTTANSVTLYYNDVYAAAYNSFNGSPGCHAISRLNNSGAFSDYNGGTAQTRLMTIALSCVGLDNGINNKPSYNIGI